MLRRIDFFGINIGSYSIKIAYVKNVDKNKPYIENITENSLLSNINTLLEDNNNIIELNKIIMSSYKNSKIKNRNCVLSISEKNVYSRLITIPYVSNSKENNEAIIWSVKSLLPLPIEQLNISYLEIGEKKINNIVYKDWYVVAANKEYVDTLHKIFDDIDLNLLAIETESISLSRLINYWKLRSLNYNNNLYNADSLIIDIGFDSSTIIISRNGVPMFSQSINIGSNSLTKALVRELNIDNQQAEIIKQNINLLDISSVPQEDKPEYKILKAMEPILDIFITEISRVLVYHKEKLLGSNVDFIFLTGGGALLKGLDVYLNNKLNINNIYTFNLTNIFKINRNINNSYLQRINSFSVPIGLCLKGYA